MKNARLLGCRPRLATALVALLVCAAGVAAGGTAQAAARPSPAAGHPAAGAPAATSLGSSGNPIPLSGTETSAAKSGRRAPAGRAVVRLGPVTASLYGVPRVAVVPGAAARRPAFSEERVAGTLLDDPGTLEADLYSGGGLRLAFLPSWSLNVEDDRVLLRDPSDPLGWARPRADIWCTAFGVQVRF